MSGLQYQLKKDSWVELTQHDGFVTYPTNDGGKDRCPCMVFARCENAAVTTVSNPILGDVPACESCAAWSAS
jgi:hypothetical protein